MNSAIFSDNRRAWSFISAAFGIQAAGSLCVLHLFRMNFADLRLPVSILVFGMLLGAGFSVYSRSRELGSWQWWIPPVLYAFFIYSLSDQSYPNAQPTVSPKFFHPAEYMVLTWFLCFGWMPVLRRGRTFSFAVRVLCTGLLFAASDEFHQSYVPGRTSQLSDVFFWDLMGIALALGAVLLANRRFAAYPVRRGEERP